MQRVRLSSSETQVPGKLRMKQELETQKEECVPMLLPEWKEETEAVSKPIRGQKLLKDDLDLQFEKVLSMAFCVCLHQIVCCTAVRVLNIVKMAWNEGRKNGTIRIVQSTFRIIQGKR